MQIQDRTFIISGGSSGLGLATALLLLSQKANVSILDLNPPQQNSSSPAISDSARTLYTTTNVSSTSSITSALSSTLKWVETTSKPLAGVICCAGIGAPALALPHQSVVASDDPTKVKMMDMALFDRVLAINLRGTVDLIRQTLPYLARNEPYSDDGERGVVVVVSSVAAYEGQVGQLAYSASKAAVAGMVLPLAREVGQKAGIRVMGIAPGLFETGMTRPPKKQKQEQTEEDTLGKPKRGGVANRAGFNPNMIEYPTRMGRGDEFARLVKEIVENPMLNGQVLRLDGAVRMPSRL